jgi:hypothetical protein
MSEHTLHPLGKLGWTAGTATCMEGAVEGTRLFQVVPGNCADHALEQASILLASARRASFIGVMDNEPTLVWAAHYLGEMAKALMDDAHRGMHKSGCPAR